MKNCPRSDNLDSIEKRRTIARSRRDIGVNLTNRSSSEAALLLGRHSRVAEQFRTSRSFTAAFAFTIASPGVKHLGPLSIEKRLVQTFIHH
jgi:hypothetical protein